MRFLRTLLLSLLLCVSAQAVSIPLYWDHDRSDITFNVWRNAAGTWRKVNRKPITEKTYVVEAQEGTHRYAVTAVYSAEVETERSNTLALRVDVTVISD